LCAGSQTACYSTLKYLRRLKELHFLLAGSDIEIIVANCESKTTRIPSNTTPFISNPVAPLHLCYFFSTLPGRHQECQYKNFTK
jgi:hypothetical protein